jgi:hypothetical protein
MMGTNGVGLLRIGLRIGKNKMKNEILKTIPFILNLIIVGLITFFIIKTDSDKSPLIFVVLYPILLLLNLIILIVFSVLKNKVYARIIKNNILFLLLLILPMFILMSSI